jgi:hypothetical protein
MRNESFAGLAMGMHAGYKQNLYRHIGLFADLSCNYVHTKINSQAQDEAEKANFFQPMGLLGLAYTLKG